MPNPTSSSGSKLSAISGNASQTILKAPPLPKSLPAHYKREWQALIRHLMGQNAWLPEKASVVEIFLLNVRLIRDAQERMDADGGLITPEGKTHPGSALIARHTGTATKLAAALGLGKDKLAAVTPSKPAKPAASTWSA